MSTLISKERTLSEDDTAFFLKGVTVGFKYIAKRHSLTPSKMWAIVAQGLLKVGMHADDLEDVEYMVFGWKSLTPDMLERYRFRYPDRCPLLDVLCTLDESCETLNQVQEWMLKLKGSKNSRRLDLLPALPTVAGLRASDGCCFKPNQHS